MQKKIIIIGTLHGGITPNHELKNVIENFNPDQLFIEIANDDILKNNLTSYPPEMLFALEWAKNKKVKFAGFDCKINTFKKGVTPEKNQAIIEKQKKSIGKLSWKELNKREYQHLLNVDSIDSLIDKEKEQTREIAMLKNIKSAIISDGTIVIITGVGHLDFFKKNIKNAIFPFGSEQKLLK